MKRDTAAQQPSAVLASRAPHLPQTVAAVSPWPAAPRSPLSAVVAGSDIAERRGRPETTGSLVPLVVHRAARPSASRRHTSIGAVSNDFTASPLLREGQVSNQPQER